MRRCLRSESGEGTAAIAASRSSSGPTSAARNPVILPAADTGAGGGPAADEAEEARIRIRVSERMVSRGRSIGILRAGRSVGNRKGPAVYSSPEPQSDALPTELGRFRIKPIVGSTRSIRAQMSGSGARVVLGIEA